MIFCSCFELCSFLIHRKNAFCDLTHKTDEVEKMDLSEIIKPMIIKKLAVTLLRQTGLL